MRELRRAKKAIKRVGSDKESERVIRTARNMEGRVVIRDMQKADCEQVYKMDVVRKPTSRSLLHLINLFL